MKINLHRRTAFFLAIGAALLLALLMILSRGGIEHTAEAMPSRSVDVIVAQSIPFRVHVTGYGNVKPALTLNGMAEVSGKISYLHPNLKDGELIPAGTVVVRIEAKDYSVNLNQAEADLAASGYALTQLESEDASLRRSLQLAEDNLAVGESEYSRIRDVYEKQLIAKSALDAEQQKVIQLRQQQEELQGKVNALASRRNTLIAQFDRAEQAVKNRKTILERTEISLPFDARIGSVAVEKNEFVTIGAKLFEAIDLNGVEITARLPMYSMGKLVSHVSPQAETGDPIFNFANRVNKRLQISAKVRLVENLGQESWEAQVLRISDAIDATRQTVGVVVGVDKPYANIKPGVRPPLIKGMYAAVDLYAPQREALVLPRRAVHEGRVYLANSEDRLEIRPVEIEIEQDELIVIKSGVEAGERVIINDLIPVIDGMPLHVSSTPELESQLRLRALGDYSGAE